MEKELKTFYDKLPKEYYIIDQPKLQLRTVIKEKMEKEGLSLRTLAAKTDGLKYPQIHRITSGENYNIDTLLKVLDALDLEISLKDKTDHK